MPTYKFLNEPSSHEIQQIAALYERAGWWPDAAAHPGLLNGIVSGSHCFLVASCRGRIVGMGRAISDGVSDAYIQDVTVSESFRGQGIGTRIVEKLVEELQKERIDWIGLIAERGSQPFYRPMGFIKMPDATPMLFKKV